ncbi:MarR family transcriptional regulator [Corynebacterium sp. USCH3]|uniref:MarR family winged helix-turn-helix transcriptional regulator n=1 Tax=Corynebacterium sp. USCH3 TaxID=3024840 RepID=UPI0030ADD31B
MADIHDPDFVLPPPRHGDHEFAEDLDARVGSHIKQAEQAMMAAKTDALRPLGLTVPQYAVLMSLHYVPGQSSAQLARVAAVTPPTMGTILDRLEKRGLIEHTPSAIHRRVLVTTLPQDGAELVLQADDRARGIEERLGRAFSDPERRQLRALLQRATSTLRGEAPEVQRHG